jgi:LuxR family glucitol operon transcriptional activator
MFPLDFLSQIAREHELSPEQEQVLLMRVGDGRSYEEIAAQLNTSPDACLKRMGLIYKKLNISGSSRGKENRLRTALSNKLEQWQELKQNVPKNPPQFAVTTQEPEPTPATVSQKPKIYQNLPAREYTAFFGRQQEIARLMELLDSNHAAHLISVDGMGGVGKTTLVVEVAYRCLEASQKENLSVSQTPTFDAIIFTSAKQDHLTAIGILPRLTKERTLGDIIREIAHTLDCTEIINLILEEQLELIRQQLSQIRTLLIVDNMETVENKQKVLAFLYDLPPTVKVVMTTREQALFVPIRLGCLPKEYGLHLIQHECLEKGVHLSVAQSEQLFLGVSGIPAAMIYAVGQMAAGYLLQDVLAQIKQPDGDVARFCFTGAVTPLRSTPAHYLLMSLALLLQPVSRDTLASIAFEQVDTIACSQGLAKLQQLSLVFQQQGRYGVLELTREYAAAELAANDEFAQQMRQRWVNWYVRFSQANGGKDWKEWHLGYGDLEAEWENLRTVLEWCISQNRYLDARAIWQHIKGYIHVRGYWDERLDWAAWLIEAAKEALDWVFAVEVMSDRAHTLIRMRQEQQLEAAEALLQEAWDLRHHSSIPFQLELATNMVILLINQEKWQQAEDWLAKEEKLLAQSSLPDLERQQQEVHILYYRGQVAFGVKNYPQAQSILQQALAKATTAGWQRATVAIQNWLADVALELGNVEETRRLLDLSFPIAQKHKDKLSIAFHQASFAKLEKCLGNLAEAKRLAKEAALAFDNLKMTVQANQMRLLMETDNG